MRIVNSASIPSPNGHYAQVVEHNGLLYISGQLPIDPVSQQPPDGFEAQATLVLDRLATILDAAGSALDSVIQARIYISDIDHWTDINALFAARFGDHRPARIIVPVPALHYGCLIELEAIAEAGRA